MLHSKIAIIMTSSLILSSFTRRLSIARGVMGFSTSFSCMPSTTSHQLMGRRNRMRYALPMRKTSSIVMWGEEDMPKRQKPGEYVLLTCYLYECVANQEHC